MNKLSVNEVSWLRILLLLSSLFFVNLSFALPFKIVPKAGTRLPTSIALGGTAIASYTVTNNTGMTRRNNHIRYFPGQPGMVTQITTGDSETCDHLFTLNSHQSCTLQLQIVGAVDAHDPDPHHHLFVCFPGDMTCAGTNFPLNVIASAPPTVPPTVTKTVPAPNETNVPANAIITATFSTMMNSASINNTTFTLSGPGTTPIKGEVKYAGTTATFQPTQSLSASTTYTATITTGAKATSGESLASPKAWSFKTQQGPTVVSTNPEDRQLHVAIGSPIIATFSTPMKSQTINDSTFLLTGPADASVTGQVTYSPDKNATFLPTNGLAFNTLYTAKITNEAEDQAGNPLTSSKVWRFCTTTPNRSRNSFAEAPVPLGTATPYAVLAGSSLMNVGVSKITGDVGLSPGENVTGFPPGEIVDGQMHVGEQAAGAQIDLLNAYNNAAGRTQTADELPNELGGLTLGPGVHKGTSSMVILTGELILQGNPDSVFILQIPAVLITVSNSRVVLEGGVSPANVFWQVGDSATLGTDSIFVGTIMATNSVAMWTGAEVNGRVLVKDGSINLDTNKIIRPSNPTPPPPPTIPCSVS